MSLCRHQRASEGFRGGQRHSQSHTADSVVWQSSQVSWRTLGCPICHRAYSFQNTPFILFGPGQDVDSNQGHVGRTGFPDWEGLQGGGWIVSGFTESKVFFSWHHSNLYFCPPLPSLKNFMLHQTNFKICSLTTLIPSIILILFMHSSVLNMNIFGGHYSA